MSEIKLNSVSEVKPEVKIEATPAAAVAFAGRERVPSDWNIVPQEEDGMIVATNSFTGRVFEGLISDFNNQLRG